MPPLPKPPVAKAASTAKPTSKSKTTAVSGAAPAKKAPPTGRKLKTAEQRKSEVQAKKERADELYEKCVNKQDIGYLWTLDHIYKLSGVSEDDTVDLCDTLLRSQLFQATTVDDVARGTSHAAFRTRTRFAAEKYRTIPDGDAREVYRHIEDVGETGALKTVLRRKLKLTDARIEKILRGLIVSKHIKQLSNARANAKKTYLLYDVAPGKDLIGGAWHDGAEIDETMIEVVSEIVTEWIKQRSWVLGPRKMPTKTHVSRKRARNDEDDTKTAVGAESKKRKLGKDKGVATKPVEKTTGDAGPNVGSKTPKVRGVHDSQATLSRRVLLPHPPGYLYYPTVGSITDMLNISGLIPNVTVSTADMRDLFRVLVASGRIERIGSRPKHSYRSEENSDEGSIIKREDEDESNAIEAEERAERQNELIIEAASEGVEPGHEGLYRWVRRPDWEVKLDNAEVEDDAVDDEDEAGGREQGKGKGPGAGNGISEVPCSKCPVANICTDDGPVDPIACEYLDTWMGSKIKDDDW